MATRPPFRRETVGGDFANFRPRDLDGLKFDVFETMDFGNGGRLERTDMDMFMDASFSGSQFLFGHLDGVHPP